MNVMHCLIYDAFVPWQRERLKEMWSCGCMRSWCSKVWTLLSWYYYNRGSHGDFGRSPCILKLTRNYPQAAAEWICPSNKILDPKWRAKWSISYIKNDFILLIRLSHTIHSLLEIRFTVNHLKISLSCLFCTRILILWSLIKIKLIHHSGHIFRQ